MDFGINLVDLIIGANDFADESKIAALAVFGIAIGSYVLYQIRDLFNVSEWRDYIRARRSGLK